MENEKETVEEVEGTELVSLDKKVMLDDNYIERAGKQIELRGKLLAIALKAVKPHDFQDFDGKPYLEGEGAARIMAVVRGFKVSEAIFKIEQVEKHYFVECQIPIEWMGQSTVSLGDCSTADPFFTGRDGNAGLYGKHLTRTGSEAMAARLILGDTKKKARENALSRAVSELLGIKGLSWADLKEIGFDKGQAGSQVKFKQGSQGGEVNNLEVGQALGATEGSIINIKGLYSSHKERDIKKRDGTKSKVTDYILMNMDGKDIKITTWGSVCKGELNIGNEMFAENVAVKEYKGSLQYTAKEISEIGGKQNDLGF